MQEFEAIIAEHLEPARRQLEREQILYEQMRSGEVEVTSEDRTVMVSITCAGEILSVDLAPGAFDQHDEKSLSKVLTSVLKVAREAGRQAAEQATEQILSERRAGRGR